MSNVLTSPSSLKRKTPEEEQVPLHGDLDSSSLGRDDSVIDEEGASPSPKPSRRRKTKDEQTQQLLDSLDPEDKRRFTAAEDRRKNNDRALMIAHAKLLEAKHELATAQNRVNEAKKEYEAVSAKAQENAEEDSDALLLEPSPWNAYYLQLKSFHDRKGHCNFKRSITDADVENMTDEEAKEMRTLSWWTWRQRKYKRRGELEQHKILLLNKLGFVWDPHAGPGPGKWLKNYALLKEFKEKFGHVKVPAKGGEYDKLASWMKTQITQYRNSKEGKMPALSQERIKLLEEIGMNWGEKRKTTPWDARYEALIEYRKRFGHVNVPWQWKEDVALAQWVNSQRKKYKDLMDGKRNNLSDEQINRLNLLGFKWNSGGKGRYTVDSPDNTSDEYEGIPTMPGVLAVPMFAANGAAVPLTGVMLEAARAANASDADGATASKPPVVPPNGLVGLVHSGIAPVSQVPLMHMMGSAVQPQIMTGVQPQVIAGVQSQLMAGIQPQVMAGIQPQVMAGVQPQVIALNPQQANTMNYAQQLAVQQNLMRYQQLGQNNEIATANNGGNPPPSL